MYKKMKYDYPDECIISYSGSNADGLFAAGRLFIELYYLSIYKLWKLLVIPLTILKHIDKNSYYRYMAIKNSLSHQSVNGQFFANVFSKNSIVEVVQEAFNIDDLDNTFINQIKLFNSFAVHYPEKIYRLKYFVYELSRVDKVDYLNAKKSGIAQVYPFKHDKLLKYMFNIPIHNKIKGLESKHNMKKLLSTYVPEQFVYRKKQSHRDAISLLNLLFKDDNERNNFISELKKSNYERYFNFNYDVIFKKSEYETIALKLVNFHIWHKNFITQT